MIDLSIRSSEPEWMDAEGIDPAEFGRCLGDLEIVNRVTLGHRPVLRWLAKATEDVPAFTLLDVGYGNGDLLRAISRWAKKNGKQAALSGIDLSHSSELAARATTPIEMPIDFRTGDVFEMDPGERFDFVVTSLMTHHLTDEYVVAFLRWIDMTARIGWFNHDLQRSVIAYYGFKAMGAIARWHAMVQHDGAVSITKAFRRGEWEQFLREAAVPGRVTWQLPFKLCVSSVR